jgi:uncharacterized protein (TIRG00374 family)
MARLKLFLTVLMIGGLAGMAFKFLDARMMAHLFAALSWAEMAVLALLPFGFLLPRAVRFGLLLVPRTRRRWVAAVYSYCASQAVSLLPAGIAGRAAVLKSAGLPFKRNLLPILADSFCDHTFFALATIAVACLVPRYRGAGYLAVPLAISAVLLLLIPPVRRRFKRITFMLARRKGRLDTWRILRRSFMKMWSLPRLAGCAALTVLANSASVLALWWTVHAFDLHVPFAALLVALLVPNLIGRLSLLPGGTGIVETGMVAILVRSGGLTPNEAAASTLLFRITDMLLPALYGLILYLLMPVPKIRPKGDQRPGGSTPTAPSIHAVRPPVNSQLHLP